MRHPYYIILILMACLTACSHSNHSIPETFPFHLSDGNSKQLGAAQRYGLGRTLKDRSQVDGVVDRLVKISDCRYYRVDRLTHSVPSRQEPANCWRPSAAIFRKPSRRAS